MGETQRNFLIIAAIALLGVVFSGAFGATAGLVSMLLNLAFALMLGATLWVLHRNKASTISAMQPAHRLLLQGSGIVLYLVFLTGTVFPGWSSWGGMFAGMFFLLIGVCIYAMYWAWQQRPFGF